MLAFNREPASQVLVLELGISQFFSQEKDTQVSEVSEEDKVLAL